MPASTTTTSTEFKNRVGEFQDKALAGPVMITKNGREHTVLLSAAEYQRLKRRDREVLRAGDFTDKDLEEIARVRMRPGNEHLNDELK
jgi:prevent-host-death family protein